MCAVFHTVHTEWANPVGSLNLQVGSLNLKNIINASENAKQEVFTCELIQEDIRYFKYTDFRIMTKIMYA